MAVINCRSCGARVNAEAIRCPECGADPRTGEGAVSDEEWMTALRERAARRELANASMTKLPTVTDLVTPPGLAGLIAAVLTLSGGVLAIVLVLRRNRRREGREG
jgi:hypothetical protein